jgi:hypothetical protein
VDTDASQRAVLVWADEDGKFLTGREALEELQNMTPLDRLRVQTAIKEAQMLLKKGNWGEAQSRLGTAEQIAAGVDARHVVRELLTHLRALRAYGNKIHDATAGLPETRAGGKPWPRPALPHPPHVALAVSREYERVVHGREEHVSGHLLPAVTAATVEEHMATAHGRGAGWAVAQGRNPLVGGSRVTPEEMMRAHEQAHSLQLAHKHAETVVTRAPGQDARDFQHAMVASAFVSGEAQAQGHHMVQGHPRTERMASKKIMPGRRY